jgi:hypothetical protein
MVLSPALGESLIVTFDRQLPENAGRQVKNRTAAGGPAIQYDVAPETSLRFGKPDCRRRIDAQPPFRHVKSHPESFSCPHPKNRRQKLRSGACRPGDGMEVLGWG